MASSRSKYDPENQANMDNILSEISFVRRETDALLHHSDAHDADTYHLTMNNDQRPTEKPITYPCPLPSYNPKRCPPDLKKAELHGKAHKVGRFTPLSTTDEVCESTGLPQRLAELPLFAQFWHLSHLGPVIPMYLLFLKQLAVFSAFLSIVAGIILHFSNESQSWSYSEIIIQLIKEKHTVEEYCIVLFCVTIILFGLIYAFRRDQKNTKLVCKKSNATISDYTVMASNLGNSHTRDEVKDFFSKNIITGYTLEIPNLNVTYDFETYVDKVRELKKLMREKSEAEQVANYIASGVVSQIESKIEAIGTYFSHHKNFLKHYEGLKKNGLAFVSFSTKQEAKTVRRKFEFSMLERSMIWFLEKCTDEFPEYFFKGNYIKVEKGPHIHEIIWENLNCHRSSFGSGLIQFIVSTGLLGCTLGLTFLINQAQQIHKSHKIYIVALVIMIFNEILFSAVGFFVRFGNFKTITELGIAFQKRVVLLQFLNSVIPLFFLYIKSIIPGGKTHELFASFSFNILIVGIIICFSPIVLRFINLPYIRKQSFRRQLNIKVSMSSGSNGITQEEANNAYEDPDFDIYGGHVNAARTLLFTSLFFSICPAIAFVGVGAFLMSHIVDKYNLLRKSVQPTTHRSELAEDIFELLDVAVFCFAVGSSIFVALVVDDGTTICSTVSFFATLLATIYSILPNKRLARSCFTNKKTMSWNQILMYQQAIECFDQTYSSVNPISKEKIDGKQLREQYSQVLKEFKMVSMLNEVPEALTIFGYVLKRPSLQEIHSQGLTGLRNPYYYFPQNFGFGADTRENFSHVETPLQTPLLVRLSQKARSHTKDRKSLAPTIKANEMVPPSTSPIEHKDNMMVNSQNSQGGSLLKDLMLITGSTEKKNQHHSKFEGKYTRGEEDGDAPHFGQGNEENSINTFMNSQFSNIDSMHGGNTYDNDVDIPYGLSPINGVKM